MTEQYTDLDFRVARDLANKACDDVGEGVARTISLCDSHPGVYLIAIFAATRLVDLLANIIKEDDPEKDDIRAGRIAAEIVRYSYLTKALRIDDPQLDADYERRIHEIAGNGNLASFFASLAGMR